MGPTRRHKILEEDWTVKFEKARHGVACKTASCRFSSFNIIKHSARPDFCVDSGRCSSEAIMSETLQYA